MRGSRTSGMMRITRSFPPTCRLSFSLKRAWAKLSVMTSPHSRSTSPVDSSTMSSARILPFTRPTHLSPESFTSSIL